MPELPEVETIRRQLAPRITGCVIIDAWHSPNPKFHAASEAVGARVVAVTRKGKYLLIGLADDRELIVHLGMTGVIRLREAGPVDPYVRAAWTLDDGRVLELRDVRQFGRIAITRAGDHRSITTLHALGPDPFDANFDSAAFYKALNGTTQRLKTKLLSQRPISGVGNIYADEALWRARVHPALRRVTRAQADRLLTALREVLEQGIDNGGTTLRDYRTFDGGTGTNQHALDCYGRAGEPCRRCTAPLARMVIDGRTSTFCPSCQRRR
jgi:formamidopyrimidine-DNA glycosylase